MLLKSTTTTEKRPGSDARSTLRPSTRNVRIPRGALLESIEPSFTDVPRARAVQYSLRRGFLTGVRVFCVYSPEFGLFRIRPSVRHG